MNKRLIIFVLLLSTLLSISLVLSACTPSGQADYLTDIHLKGDKSSENGDYPVKLSQISTEQSSYDDKGPIFDRQVLSSEALNTVYDIKASIDEDKKRLSASVDIHYTNTSDQALDDIQVIFPMKCLSVDNRLNKDKNLSRYENTGADIFDDIVEADDFKPITLKIEAISLREGNSDSSLESVELPVSDEWLEDHWTGNHQDALWIPLDKALEPEQEVTLEFKYSFDLPHSDYLGMTDDMVGLNCFYPLVPYFEEGQWQSDYAKWTWFYHVPYAQINVDISSQSPYQWVSPYELTDSQEDGKLESNHFEAEGLVDRSLSLFLVQNRQIRQQTEGPVTLTYVYPKDETFWIDEDLIGREIKFISNQDIMPKKDSIMVFLNDQGENRNLRNGKIYNMQSYSRAEILDDLDNYLIMKLSEAEFNGINEEGVMLKDAMSYYHQVHIYTNKRQTDLDTMSQKYVGDKMNQSNLKLWRQEDYLNAHDFDLYYENRHYKSTLLLVKLEEAFGVDRVSPMILDFEKDYAGKGVLLEDFMTRVKETLGQEADPILDDFGLLD